MTNQSAVEQQLPADVAEALRESIRWDGDGRHDQIDELKALLEREALAHLRSRQQREQAERERDEATGLSWVAADARAKAAEAAKDAAEARVKELERELQIKRDIIGAGQAANVEQRRTIDELGRMKMAAEARCQAVASEMGKMVKAWREMATQIDQSATPQGWQLARRDQLRECANELQVVAKQLQEPSR